MMNRSDFAVNCILRRYTAGGQHAVRRGRRAAVNTQGSTTVVGENRMKASRYFNNTRLSAVFKSNLQLCYNA